MRRAFLALSFLLLFIAPARAEFLVSSAILEFNADSQQQQDIELINRSKDADYIATEIKEVLNPGESNETKVSVTDPARAGLLVTPDKTILAAGTRKVLRFVLLKKPDEREHIYRVAVKPVVRGTTNTTQVGLKILVGYEVLVIVRPAMRKPSFTATRAGKFVSIANTGNTNIFLHNGQQCEKDSNCRLLPAARIYPGQNKKIELPDDRAATYLIWDGKDTIEKKLD